jgi:phosphoribosylformylglycinamidine synthase
MATHGTNTLSVLVLAGAGFNCDEETVAAYRKLGCRAARAHVYDWFDGRAPWSGHDLVHLPGGFSYGDRLGSGKALAARVRYGADAQGKPLFDEVRAHLAAGGFLVGICNGFQVLTKCGLLPNLSGRFEQEASLTTNDSGRFEDRWVTCAGQGAPFDGASFDLPVRHGEGRLVYRDDAVAQASERLEAFAYVDAQGARTATFPENPNGSPRGAAALWSQDGQVFGMMPHPEAFLFRENHPAWPTRAATDPAYGRQEPDGLRLLRALCTHIAVKRGRTPPPAFTPAVLPDAADRSHR